MKCWSGVGWAFPSLSVQHKNTFCFGPTNSSLHRCSAQEKVWRETRERDENRKYGSEARQLGGADDGQSRCREERKERGSGASAPGLRKSVTGLSLH